MLLIILGGSPFSVLEIGLNQSCVATFLMSFGCINIYQLFWQKLVLVYKNAFHSFDQRNSTWSIILLQVKYLRSLFNCLFYTRSILHILKGFYSKSQSSRLIMTSVLFLNHYKRAWYLWEMKCMICRKI